VEFTENIKFVDENAFSNCNNLNNVYISNIENWLNIDFENVEANPLNNGAKLFINGEELKEFLLPYNINNVKKYAFAGCTSISSAIIPGKLKKIAQEAFSGCIRLTELEIQDGINTIEDFAFFRCTGLTSLNLPQSLSKINDGAFNQCTSLNTIKMHGSNPPTANVSVFSDNTYSHCLLSVPSDGLSKYETYNTWRNFQNIESY
jgi:hypothetical protein